jgi:hypothetical protein
MSDLALIFLFFSMILVPCAMASHSLRAKRSGQFGRSSAMNVVGDPDYSDRYHYARLEPRHDRKALAMQRSRDLYYRERAKRFDGTASIQFPSTEQPGPVLVDKKVG